MGKVRERPKARLGVEALKSALTAAPAGVATVKLAQEDMKLLCRALTLLELVDGEKEDVTELLKWLRGVAKEAREGIRCYR